MPNTSATGGYLSPGVSPAPLEDTAFENFLQEIFVALTGLDETMVRPRWQPESPNQPDFGVDWIAFGITEQDPDTYAATVQGETNTEFQRHETVTVLISSYGDNASKNLAVLRDGLQVEQNRAVLTANAMGLVETTRMVTAPALIKEKWTRRFDMKMIFRRQIRRVYSVLTILTAEVDLNAEVIQETITVQPAP